jgi:excisionase family DNA binding protein
MDELCFTLFRWVQEDAVEVYRENLTVRETIERFGIARTRLYAAIRDQEIEAFKLGRRTLIRTESVKAFFDRLPRSSGSAW